MQDRAIERAARFQERIQEAHERKQAQLERRQRAIGERIRVMHERVHGMPPARGEARERILGEADALFRRRGFADVSMQDIADAAGVTKAAMYYHFASKEQLFEEFAQLAINSFWEGIIEHAEANGPLREVVRGIIGYVTVAFQSISMSIVEDIQRHLSSEAQGRILFEHPTPGTALVKLFERATARGEMRPLDVSAVAEMFLAMLMSLGHRGHTSREPQPGDDDLLIDVLLHGIAPSADRK